MSKIIDFLKNDITGWKYLIVVLVSIFFIFVIIGYLGDRQYQKLQSELNKAKGNASIKKTVK